MLQAHETIDEGKRWETLAREIHQSQKVEQEQVSVYCEFMTLQREKATNGGQNKEMDKERFEHSESSSEFCLLCRDSAECGNEISTELQSCREILCENMTDLKFSPCSLLSESVNGLSALMIRSTVAFRAERKHSFVRQ